MTRQNSLFILLVASLFMQSDIVSAGMILPADVTNGSASFTTSDGEVTLNPLQAGGTPGSLGSSGCCIGVVGGTNNVAVTDGDGDPMTTDDREQLDIVLSSNVGLSEIGFIFTRANGAEATDGVVITGFASDPMASLNDDATTDGVTLNFDSGTLYVNHGWRGGNNTTVSFADLTSSQGLTVSVLANDSDEAGAQAAISGISYEVVPEPAALTVSLLGFLGLLLTRKRK